MSKSIAPRLFLATLAAGCVSQAQFLDGKQGLAMQTAVSRGQFEMNCPVATEPSCRERSSSPCCKDPC